MSGKRDHSRERTLRRGQAEAERRLWTALRSRRLCGFRFRRQHRIGRFYVDFACLRDRVVVEVDGSQHSQQVAYDTARTAFLHAHGFTVLRFWNHDVLARLPHVLAAIEEALRTPHPASLREAVPLPASGARD